MNELLTVSQVAEYLKLKPKTIRYKIKNKEIHGFIKVGRQWRIEESDLKKYIESLKEDKL